jgi:uncharacterized membrane protein
MTAYASLKFVHVLVAIIALGTSAGLGILLEFFGNHPVHGAFVLRAIRRLLYLVVLPGYVVMLASGMWLTHLAWSLSARWIQAALGLWVIGAGLLVLSIGVLHEQIALFETQGTASAAYRRVALLERVLGGGAGLVVVTIVYFMVTKPA